MDIDTFVQYGAMGLLAGLACFAYWKERARANRAERRLEAKSEKWLTMYHSLANGFRETVDALERRFPEEE